MGEPSSARAVTSMQGKKGGEGGALGGKNVGLAGWRVGLSWLNNIHPGRNVWDMGGLNISIVYIILSCHVQYNMKIVGPMLLTDPYSVTSSPLA